MFTAVNVDGFRSLLRFNLTLQAGLNVLVGSNGTGKSNFISFLDFLSAFIGSDLNNAIAVSQGAGSAFSRERFTSDEALLAFSIEGRWLRNEANDQYEYFAYDDNSHSGEYNYSCEITYSRTAPAVYVSKEQIVVSSDKGTSIRVSRATDRVNRSFSNNVRIDAKPTSFKDNLLRLHMRNEDRSSPEEELSSRLSPERSMLRYLSNETPGLTYVTHDLCSYRSVNIDPVIARQPTPVGGTFSLEPTGRGLAGALYQIKRGSFSGNYIRRYHPLFIGPRRNVSFESILSWCREVNPSIDDITVDLDFSAAQLRPSMSFVFGDHTQSFPFSRISDGTVKWLSLATIIIAEPVLNIIEEPENFLHPFMQESFVMLCRQALEANPDRTIILSTHSPTLLDACSPGELTMFELADGESRATRVSNRDELDRKIRNSRFGLGHYYRTGALYGEDSGAG